jgi:hypothetical protein
MADINFGNSVTVAGSTTGDLSSLDLYIDEYAGEVETQFVKKSFMKDFVPVKPVRGTDTITNDVMGITTLKAVGRGAKRVEPGNATFDKITLTVDTIILARNTVALLDQFQNRYDVRMELGMDHGKEIGKFFDEAFIIQGIKCADKTFVGDGGTASGVTNGVANVQVLASAGDENDPDKLQRGIEDVCQKIEEDDVDLDGGVILVRPAQYYVLLRNDRLINSQFSTGNGDFAEGMILKSCGLPIIKTNRIPAAAITDHKLGTAYNIDATEAKTVALVLLPKALLAGESIPLTSDVWYNKEELQWFIDSYLAFGVAPNRHDMCGLVRKA